jgi:hypothetical protein
MLQGTEVIAHCRHPWADAPYKVGDPVNLMPGFSHGTQPGPHGWQGQTSVKQQGQGQQQQHGQGQQGVQQQQQGQVAGVVSGQEPPSEASDAAGAGAGAPTHVYLDHQHGCLVLQPDILLSGMRGAGGSWLSSDCGFELLHEVT